MGARSIPLETGIVGHLSTRWHQADQALPGNHTSARPGTRTGPDRPGQDSGKASTEGRLTHRRNVYTICL